MALPPLEHFVYGPVRSRRLGAALGVNLLPSGLTVCNMTCAYCQYGRIGRAARYRGEGVAWPRPQAIEAALAARLMRAAAADEIIDRITVAGHGEPTLHPDFEEIVDRLCAVRDREAPGLPLAILSNSTTAASRDVRRALERFDERYMKLDAGDPITYARLNGGGPSIGRIVDALRGLAPIMIQAMFVKDARGEIDNTTDGVVGDWLNALERIRPARVHVYTMARPRVNDHVGPAPARRLREIAERVRGLGIPADVFDPFTPERARRPVARRRSQRSGAARL
jgi:wyosine [tRNA(Phe)-imidazoG37] synthetase (radical SAM superfamily)